MHPSVIPPYASDCSSAAAYSSVCSCWGITATAITTTPTVTATSTATSTILANGACSGGGTCNHYTIHSCGLGPIGECVCGLDPEWQGFCFLNDFCRDDQDVVCTSNSHCAENQRCLVSNCCGHSICVPLAPAGQCPDPLSPRLIFRAAERRSGRRSGGCAYYAC